MITAETKKINMKIGAVVRARRVSIAMSQDTLGDAIGVSFQQVQKYETGQNTITLPRAIAIGKALGLRLADFVPQANATISALAALPPTLAKNYQKLGREDQTSVMALVSSLAKKNGVHDA